YLHDQPGLALTIATSALNIERISDDAYQSVRNLMAWLRPAILDELGLVLALQHMVDDWNSHHEDTFCSLRIDADVSRLDAQRQIQVYRIVQEALTNVAKHAQADRVEVSITGSPQADSKPGEGTTVRVSFPLEEKKVD